MGGASLAHLIAAAYVGSQIPSTSAPPNPPHSSPAAFFTITPQARFGSLRFPFPRPRSPRDNSRLSYRASTTAWMVEPIPPPNRANTATTANMIMNTITAYSAIVAPLRLFNKCIIVFISLLL